MQIQLACLEYIHADGDLHRHEYGKDPSLNVKSSPWSALCKVFWDSKPNVLRKRSMLLHKMSALSPPSLPPEFPLQLEPEQTENEAKQRPRTVPTIALK